MQFTVKLLLGFLSAHHHCSEQTHTHAQTRTVHIEQALKPFYFVVNSLVQSQHVGCIWFYLGHISKTCL